MIEEFEYKGTWWLPDKPGKQIPGTLRFTPSEGAILDLIGDFRDIKKDTIEIGKMLQPEIILGASSDGRAITLYKCQEELGIASGGVLCLLLTHSFYADVVFVGAHFQKPEDIKFRSLSTHYSYLDEWVNISGFDIQHNKQEVVVKYKILEPIRVTINDNYKLLIDFEATYTALSIAQKEVSIKQKTYIKVEASEEKAFEECRRIMHYIGNFLSLGVMEPVYPLAIIGTTEVNKERVEDKTYYPPVEIYYMLLDVPKVPKKLLPFDMLFTFKDVSDRFEYFLKNWFGKVELLEPVYSLYFGTLYNPGMYLEHRFLSLIRAMESFHQRVYGGEYLSDENYKEVYNALVNAIPDNAIPDLVKKDFKESLENKLKYGNEFSLRRRLREILDKCLEIVNIIENKNAFINKVVDTRNYQIHHDKELKKRAASGEDLYHLTQKLKILLEICLLTESGFSSEEIKGLFSRNRRYQRELRIRMKK